MSRRTPQPLTGNLYPGLRDPQQPANGWGWVLFIDRGPVVKSRSWRSYATEQLARAAGRRAAKRLGVVLQEVGR